MNRLSKLRVLMMACVLITLSLAAGCSNDNPVTTSGSTAQTPGYNASPTDSLVISSVKVLIKNVSVSVASVSRGQSGTRRTTNLPGLPAAMEINLSSSSSYFNAVSVPEGVYDMAVVEVGRLDPDARGTDPALTHLFSDNGQTYSIVVYGTFNNSQFTYRSQVSAAQEINYNPPKSFSETQKSLLPLKVRPVTWFQTPSGYLNPGDPANRMEIENRITMSLKGIKEVN